MRMRTWLLQDTVEEKGFIVGMGESSARGIWKGAGGTGEERREERAAEDQAGTQREMAG